MGGYDRLRLVEIPLSAFFVSTRWASIVFCQILQTLGKIHFAKMCKTKNWPNRISNSWLLGVASEISWFAILGLSNRTPQASLRHDMSWPIPPTWCHEGEFQIMFVLYGFLKTGIDNRNIFNFVYMLMKDTELYHIQWFLWGLTSMYGTQSFPKFWYYPQFLGEKSAIIAREPKFWYDSQLEKLCSKVHQTPQDWCGNDFTHFWSFFLEKRPEVRVSHRIYTTVWHGLTQFLSEFRWINSQNIILQGWGETTVHFVLNDILEDFFASHFVAQVMCIGHQHPPSNWPLRCKSPWPLVRAGERRNGGWMSWLEVWGKKKWNLM